MEPKPTGKNLIILHPDEFKALDEFHRAAATVLQRKGKIRIVDAEGVPSL